MESYIITPVNYENGCVVLDEKPTKPTKVGETVTIPTDGAAYLGDGGANVSFSFDCSLGFPSGYTPKGNCYICIYEWCNSRANKDTINNR